MIRSALFLRLRDLRARRRWREQLGLDRDYERARHRQDVEACDELAGWLESRRLTRERRQ